MIEWKMVDRYFLPFREGRQLCSARDPEREALRWVEALEVRGASHLIVLGCGAGYHLVELKKHFPLASLLVVDCDFSVLEKWSGQLDTLLVDSEFLKEASSAFDEVVRPRLAKGFEVVSFRPAWAGQDLLFQNMEDFLLGHTQKTEEIGAYFGDDSEVLRWIQSVPSTQTVGMGSLFSMRGNDTEGILEVPIKSPWFLVLSVLRELVL